MGDVLIGNYYDRMTKAMVNVPITPDLALRLATFSDNHQPYYNNAGPVKTITPSENADVLSSRASLLWTPAPAVKVTLVYDWTHERRHRLHRHQLRGGAAGRPAARRGSGSARRHLPRPAAVAEHAPLGHRRDAEPGSGPGAGRADQQLPRHELLPDHGRQRRASPSPGMAPPQIDNWSTSYWHTSSKSTVQELRIYAPDAARFKWSAGGFFFYEKQTAFLGSTNDQSNGLCRDRVQHAVRAFPLGGRLRRQHVRHHASSSARPAASG